MNISRDIDNNNQVALKNNEASDGQINIHKLEKMEEEKLKLKYPILRSPKIKNIIMQKRLQKGQKYFDSGDYQMAKQKGHDVSQIIPNMITGDIIPTIETLRARNSSIIRNKSSTTHCNKPETPKKGNMSTL
uniref:Uncharacterized protein n=1 Tax=Glossina brevipalpis TaxID=37001 RepID=A0A1A9VZU6_9MUSC